MNEGGAAGWPPFLWFVVVAWAGAPTGVAKLTAMRGAVGWVRLSPDAPQLPVGDRPYRLGWRLADVCRDRPGTYAIEEGEDIGRGIAIWDVSC